MVRCGINSHGNLWISHPRPGVEYEYFNRNGTHYVYYTDGTATFKGHWKTVYYKDGKAVSTPEPELKLDVDTLVMLERLVKLEPVEVSL